MLHRSVTNRAASVVAADAEKRRLAEKVSTYTLYTMYVIFHTSVRRIHYAVHTFCYDDISIFHAF
jgi:hypothetical protein